ncbi:MAG: hypothetical protein K0R15_2297 [Clostridiales bacterium]|jgi:hypothetical protein|nr:hypothetical protein [Clostridiales bacterium]
MNQRLANIAQVEAQKFYHGFVMKTEPYIEPITRLFPDNKENKWDNHWCAEFIYFCCKQAGYDLPVRYPDERVTSDFSASLAWEQWAQLPSNNCWHCTKEVGFAPERGDIVIYDKVFKNKEHDHIGIVLEVKENSIITAEGNINNVSGIIERKLDKHIRGFIRMK